jgi:hypothetical protein
MIIFQFNALFLCLHGFCIVFMRTLHDVHKVKAYRAVVFVRPHDSTRERLDGLG